GSNASSGAMIYTNNGPIYVNGTRVLISGGWSTASGGVLMVALDLDHNKIWFGVSTNPGVWNNTVGDNPATNTGGFSISGLPGALYPAGVITGGGSQSFTAKFSAPFTNAVPSGFSPWDLTVTNGALAVTLDPVTSSATGTVKVQGSL